MHRLAVCVVLTLVQGQLPADCAVVYGHGSVLGHFTDITAAVHVALDDDLRRSHAACQHQSQQEESSFTTQSILMSYM